MPVIGTPSLTIAHNTSTNIVDITVNVPVRYSAIEICLANSCNLAVGRLRCQLWGDDGGFWPPDFLYLFPGSISLFATTNGTSTETFTATLGAEMLNEDNVPWNQDDEIYARVHLFDDMWTWLSVRRSNNVNGFF